jgi:enolase-phosphatase E1
MPLCAVVVDIEGTTSATDFVVRRLYPYSVDRFADWIAGHREDPDTARAVGQIRALLGEPDAGDERIVAALRAWVAADEKATPLKTIQGRIWARGFATGELVAHFYPDVIPALREWRVAGQRLYVFSSGSVAAQRSWFGHTPEGDLQPLVSGYFDTENAGPKRDPGSYRRIAAATGTAPEQTVFLSDVVAELDAARAVGWHTVAVRRPGEPHGHSAAGDHPAVASFADLDLTGDRPDTARVGQRRNASGRPIPDR